MNFYTTIIRKLLKKLRRNKKCANIYLISLINSYRMVIFFHMIFIKNENFIYKICRKLNG